MVSTMHTYRSRLLVVVLVMLAGAVVSADRVRLRSGKVVEGTFIGADSSTVRLLSRTVRERSFRSRCRRRRVNDRTRRSGGTEAGADASAGPGANHRAGEHDLNVRLCEAIDVDAPRREPRSRAGGRSGEPMAGVDSAQCRALYRPSGSSSRKSKAATRSREANSISFGGQTYESPLLVEAKGGGEGKKSARKIGGGVGLGAIVGGIAGGGSGAAIGAAVGGVTGAVVASQGQEHLKLPAETRLQFQLSAAVTVKP